MELTNGQQAVMNAEGHILVTGGPGSGKTTISILKAAQITQQHISAGQKVLFLSFARATVSRVVEAIEHEQHIPPTQKQLIEVETYHSFFWRILKTHGYLIGLPRKLTILPPSDEAVALATIRASFSGKKLTSEQKEAKKKAEATERLRLAREEGKISFDLFASYVGDILHGSKRVCCLISNMYPTIILDEFQDTNETQWRVVQALGCLSRLIALADPEQRIYDWIGANPRRLCHFQETFAPLDIDLSATNHRSAGTEISLFGNDVLLGKFRQSTYIGIKCCTFNAQANQAMTKLVVTTYAARKRLIEQNMCNWSLAILVPTKKMTRLVSDALNNPPAKMSKVPHSAVIELDAAILGAEIIAFLMQPATGDNHFSLLIDLICNYFRGKGGDKPTNSALTEAANIRKSYNELLARKTAGKDMRAKSIVVNILETYKQSRALMLTGIPEKDWLCVRNLLEDGSCKRLKEIAEETKNIRFLKRGIQLRQELSQNWRDTGGYHNALDIIRHAFIQQHFATNAKPESGVVVMNMHKAKGKQFDEVIIFEGWPLRKKREIISNLDRIVYNNLRENVNDSARQNFRVSVTRSKLHTTILTPKCDPCVLLLSEKDV